MSVTAPIATAINALLDARTNLRNVQASTFPGTRLWDCMQRAIGSIDAAIVGISGGLTP